MTYGYSYGLSTIEYSDGAAFADPRSGMLYFGGIDGLVTVEETGFEEEPYAPPVLFATCASATSCAASMPCSRTTGS